MVDLNTEKYNYLVHRKLRKKEQRDSDSLKKPLREQRKHLEPEGSRELMDADMTDLELLAALKSCSDSAPGSDGIPYSVYKKLWVIAGPFILDAWNHSCSIGVQPLSHRESIIVILPKEGKDIKDITLNCLV